MSLLQPSPASTTFRYRRTADFTALRLGRAILGYLAVIVAIITLAPFRFASAPVHGLTSLWNWQDLILNVVMFMPFGFVYQLTRPRGTPFRWPKVLLLGAVLSGAIEIAQLFAPTRYTSLLDLATNTTGTLLGAWAFNALAARVRGDAAVRLLALELPLMGLVYLLVPLCWLIGLGSEAEVRRLLVLGPSVMAGAILGTVHASFVRHEPGGGPRRFTPPPRGIPWWLVASTLGWSLVALVPGARGDLSVIVSGTLLTLASGFLRDIGTRRIVRAGGSRRLELPTLRMVLPIFAAYLALSALWPLTDATPVWHGALALTLPGVPLSQPLVYRALEQVAAFTLVGYMGAEYHGREDTNGGTGVLRLAFWSGVAAVLLQAARGFHESHGASLSLLVLTQIAGVFGQWVYILQRAHVQALVKRRALLERLRQATSMQRAAA
ncbi:VanZ family protein [Gemmatimonas phototrophica]|uniref:VanZ family protein n=1 Tax=Gemmatimonas phototrophica TaxID=1379270 RepID=UPI0006A6F9DB|nr:VanZ family protein [Gemmatimonas phototrophica]